MVIRDLWSALYTDDIPAEQTGRECDFIMQFLPLAEFPDVLDLACGTGRHSIELARRGYGTAAVDMDPKALHVAEASACTAGVSIQFIVADLLDLGTLDRTFDGILLFWQSFGYFDTDAQAGLFTSFHRLLRPGGRLILDLYNRLHFTRGFVPHAHNDFHEPLPVWDISLFRPLPLGYEEDLRFERRRAVDLFDPHLFSPGEIAGLAANYDFHLIASCSDFHPTTPATPEKARMQLAFERL